MNIGVYLKIKGAQKIQSKLQRAGKTIPDELQKAMGKACLIVQRTTKRYLTNVSLNVRTNRLRGSIQYKVIKRGREVSGVVGSNVIYAAIHEFGRVILAKGKPMIFEIDGRVIRTMRVKIPARPSLSPAVEDNRARIFDIIGGGVDSGLKKAGLK